MNRESVLTDPFPVPTAKGPVNARVSLPGSKSFTNRALPIAALAAGISVLSGVLNSDDTRYMVEALQQLGIVIDLEWDADRLTVHGADGFVPVDKADLFLGNSGTSMRFLTALGSLAHGQIRLDGTVRMRQRPLAPLIDGLESLGINIRSESNNGCPPVVIVSNGLPGGTVEMAGELSSQYFSALAMMLPYADEPLDIRVQGDLVSQPYLDMTAGTMADFGVELHHEEYQRIWVTPGQRYAARQYAIEPDASAASYFFALAAVTGGTIVVERLPASSLQGDTRFVDVLEQMGCVVVRRLNDISVTGPDQLNGIEIDMNSISDTVQTLAAIAPFARNPVVIRNVRHIRYKETDRISAVATELRRLGIMVEEFDDGIAIQPGIPKPAVIQTYDDHRMAMSFAIAGTRTPGIQIADPGCVAKTVPGFWDILLPLL